MTPRFNRSLQILLEELEDDSGLNPEFDGKKIEDYLIWEPEGDLRVYADFVNSIPSKSNETYRGLSTKEFSQLHNQGYLKSDSRDVGRGREGTYSAGDSKLAGRFALRNARDLGSSVFLVLDKDALPNLTWRNDWDFSSEIIPRDAIKHAYLFRHGKVKTLI